MDGGGVTGRLLFQPGQVKHFPPGALRRSLADKGMTHKLIEQLCVSLSRCPPRAPVVKAITSVLAAPGIEQEIAGASVKAKTAAIIGQDGYI